MRLALLFALTLLAAPALADSLPCPASEAIAGPARVCANGDGGPVRCWALRAGECYSSGDAARLVHAAAGQGETVVGTAAKPRAAASTAPRP